MKNIILVLADDIAKGEEVIRHYKLDADMCAVITDSSHLEDVSLIPNETVYAHSHAHNDLLTTFVDKSKAMPKDSNVNLQILKT